MNYAPRPRNSAFLLNLLQANAGNQRTNDEKRTAEAKRRIGRNTRRNTLQTDSCRRINLTSFNSGDLVLIKNTVISDGTSQKLKRRRKGPYLVKEKVVNRYRIINQPQKRKYDSLYPVEHLRKYSIETDSDESEDLIIEEEL